MRKPLSQYWNHKIKYPGSLSAYSVKVKITGNAKNQQNLIERFMDIQPGLERYLRDKGLMLETQLLKREDNDCPELIQ